MTQDLTAPTDVDAIVATVRDYFESWFTGDAERMRRALHPQLAKRGMVRGVYDDTTAAEMVSATADGVGTRHEPSRRAITVDVVHVHGDIASATVTGSIYVEYVHLARVDGAWQIVNTMWALADEPAVG